MFDYKKHFLYAMAEGGGDEPEPETPKLPTPVTTKEQYLYAKVTGGDTSNLPTPVTTEEQYLYAMAQSGGGGGGGGGGDRFVVNFSGTTDDGNAACDKTWAEISAAYSAGKEIVVFYVENGFDYLQGWPAWFVDGGAMQGLNAYFVTWDVGKGEIDTCVYTQAQINAANEPVITTVFTQP